jgi:hypothetical protein
MGYLLVGGHISEFATGPVASIAVSLASTALGILCLFACAVATWRFPKRAALFAWAAAYAYFVPGLLSAWVLKLGLMDAFYYAAAARFAAAWSMTLLSKRAITAG